MKRRIPILVFSIILIAFVIGIINLKSILALLSLDSPDNHFVTRSGSTLILQGKPFRFAGANIYWLGLQDLDDTVSYPTPFSVDDVLATASFMGETVVRSHTLGISVGCDLCVEPSRGVFNQTALQQIDYALQSAKKHHLRLIIPLVDNWHYYHGGKHTFTDWHGLSNEEDFYTHPSVINDFKQYISTILNHVNSYTKVAYKDDPTILSWETGNELSAPRQWVEMISAYIKEIAPRHLVMDGNYEQANELTNFSSNLSIPTVDIYTGHYYPPTISALRSALKQANDANKVFIVGEYDWNTTEGDELKEFLATIEQSNVAGDLYWSLFAHGDSHGLLSNKEHFVLHYPGDTPAMRNRVTMLHAHANQMHGMTKPSERQPGIPAITAIDGSNILWRGAYGADTYTIERSTQGITGPWEVICDRCVTDLSIPWVDTKRPSGTVAYRIRAHTSSGVPGPYSAIYWFKG